MTLIDPDFSYHKKRVAANLIRFKDDPVLLKYVKAKHYVKISTGLYYARCFDGIISRGGGNLHEADDWVDSDYGLAKKCGADPLVLFLERAETGDNWSFYGVCDSPEQFLEVLGNKLADPNFGYCVSFAPVRKSEQPTSGGWRWHKWGPYIGNHSPRCEYLADEDGIEVVYCYHIYMKFGYKPPKKKKCRHNGSAAMDRGILTCDNCGEQLYE